MVVDAAFTSIGLNYFTAVVPKVEEFNEIFVKTRNVTRLADLAAVALADLRKVWMNERSWFVAKDIATYLATQGNDCQALRSWAQHTNLKQWKADPVGKVHGIGLVTYQYLRMMGGIDTVMPDKIVKRAINELLAQAGNRPVNENLAFIKKVEKLAHSSGYRPIELCWMTWLIQSEGQQMRTEKYRTLLTKI